MVQAAPEHWTQLTGPANWFRLWHPPRWTTEVRQGVYALKPPNSSAILAVQALWINEEEACDARRLDQIIRKFPSSRKVCKGNEKWNEQVVESLQGEAVLEVPRHWWERFLPFRRWRNWRMWALQKSHLLLIVTLIHDNERDPELESLAKMVVRCMELPTIPADPPEVFASRVLKLSRQHFPRMSIDLVDGFQMQIDSCRLNLADWYRAYVQNPDRFEQILESAVTSVTMTQLSKCETALPRLEMIRDRIMPMLLPQQVWEESFSQTPSQPWVAGLVIVYVVDEMQTMWYVRAPLLNHWKLTVAELHEIAIENLQTYFDKRPMEMTVAASQDGVPSVMMPSEPDSYNCVRLLCPEFLKKLRTLGCGNLAVGMPGREFFVAVNIEQRQIIEQIRQQVRCDYDRVDYPLTTRLLLISPDGVSELIEDDAR